MKLKIGQPVMVFDEGLALLRRIMGPTAKPNHHGWVHEILDNGNIMVEFPIGDDNPNEHSQIAPYESELVVIREGKWRDEI